MLRLTTLIPVGLFSAIAVALGMGLSNDPRELPSMLADRPVPEFALPPLIKNVEGLKSTDLEGRGVTLLNVFASWCGGCRYEHPLLMELAKDKRMKLVAINWKDRPKMGASWIAQYGNPYEQIGEDKSGRTGIDLGVTGLPETFVIDGDGRVRYRLAGPMTPEIWKTEIEPLIVDIAERAKGKT